MRSPSTPSYTRDRDYEGRAYELPQPADQEAYAEWTGGGSQRWQDDQAWQASQRSEQRWQVTAARVAGFGE